jgi:cytidylate kinase
MVRKIEQIVEEQAKRWRIEQREHQERKRESRPLAKIVALSNAYGSHGIPIAHKIGELLGYPVYDREIVEHIATNAHVRVDLVETLDERAQGAMDDYITGLFREKSFYQDDYARELTRTIVSLWHHGPCVIVGHGCCHIVPRSHSLAVRLTSPPAARALRVQSLESLATIDQAKRRLDRVDAEREAFIRKFFGVRIDDPLAYDVIINTARFDTQSCAETVVETFRRRFREE